MGLKFIITLSYLFFVYWLKSDQNGIEISDGLGNGVYKFVLKSDQNGIEIETDWMDGDKEWTELKSDQNGIEMRKQGSPNRGHGGWLKSDQNGIEINEKRHGSGLQVC